VCAVCVLCVCVCVYGGGEGEGAAEEEGVVVCGQGKKFTKSPKKVTIFRQCEKKLTLSNKAGILTQPRTAHSATLLHTSIAALHL